MMFPCFADMVCVCVCDVLLCVILYYVSCLVCLVYLVVFYLQLFRGLLFLVPLLPAIFITDPLTKVRVEDEHCFVLWTHFYFYFL